MPSTIFTSGACMVAVLIAAGVAQAEIPTIAHGCFAWAPTVARTAWIEAHKVPCHAECDGGTVEIARAEGASLDVRTPGFVVVQFREDGDCGGAAWLTDGGAGSGLFRPSRAVVEIREEDL